MGVGNLRVLNDDVIMPRNGFDMHSHQNMEIVTIMLDGTLTHEDDLGNRDDIEAGEMQVMSAGSGITHSEYNHSRDGVAKLFQIWFVPNKLNTPPHYTKMNISHQQANTLIPLVSPNGGDGSVPIQQNAWLYRGVYESIHFAEHRLNHSENRFYIFVIDGEIVIDEHTLCTRDAAVVYDTERISFEVMPRTEFLLFEV